MIYKGTIVTVAKLPENGKLGDTYYCDREGVICTCVGNPPEWVQLEGFKTPEDKLLKVYEALSQDNSEYILKETIRKLIE